MTNALPGADPASVRPTAAEPAASGASQPFVGRASVAASTSSPRAASTSSPRAGSASSLRAGSASPADSRLRPWPWRDWLGSVVVALAFLGLWALVTRLQWISPVFFPSPGATFEALVAGLHDDLLPLLGATVERMVYGWLLASALGVAVGALIGTSPEARRWLQPTLEFIRPLPASSIIPLAISLVGLSAAMVLTVIAFGAMWPVMLATVHGFASVEPRLHEVGQVLRLSRTGFIAKIGLPNAMPDVLAGMRLSLTVALILAIVGEMLASQQGLGTAILMAARSFRSADLFAGVALLGLVGFASNAMLGLAERRLLRWKNG